MLKNCTGKKNPYSYELKNPIFSFSVEKKVNALDTNETVSDAFEVLKVLFPSSKESR